MQELAYTSQQEIPGFQELLIDTNTSPDDWLIGIAAIAEFLERDAAGVTRLLNNGKLTGEKVIKGNRLVWIASKEIARDYKRSHAIDKIRKTNHMINDYREKLTKQETIVLKNGSPVIGAEEARQIVLALHNLKLAIENNTRAVNKLLQK